MIGGLDLVKCEKHGLNFMMTCPACFKERRESIDLLERAAANIEKALATLDEIDAAIAGEKKE